MPEKKRQHWLTRETDPVLKYGVPYAAGVYTGLTETPAAIGKIVEGAGYLTRSKPLQSFGRYASKYWSGLGQKARKKVLGGEGEMPEEASFPQKALYGAGQITPDMLAVSSAFTMAKKARMARDIPRYLEHGRGIVRDPWRYMPTSTKRAARKTAAISVGKQKVEGSLAGE